MDNIITADYAVVGGGDRTWVKLYNDCKPTFYPAMDVLLLNPYLIFEDNRLVISGRQVEYGYRDNVPFEDLDESVKIGQWTLGFGRFKKTFRFITDKRDWLPLKKTVSFRTITNNYEILDKRGQDAVDV